MPELGTDRYQLLERVGEGAFGAVYRAWDRESGCEVALKLLQRINADALLQFKQEFRTAQEVEHPNLVRLHELFASGDTWYFVMEYVAGVDMLDHVRDALRRGWRTDAVRLRRVLFELAEGLVALHNRGLLHRDVKPSNVRVTPQGRAVLLDFGLVQDRTAQSEVSTQARGTLAYMPPEQMAAEELTPAADWYAFGVLLFEALTGRQPFMGAPLEMLKAKERKPPAPADINEDVPADLSVLCVQLLNPTADQRPSAEQILAHLSAGQGRPATLSGTHRGLATADLVGRDEELASLQKALATAKGGELATVFIEGESGVGKSTLVRAFTLAQAPEQFIWWGRCREREAVPYNALDEAVDAMSTSLSTMPDQLVAGLLPERAALIPQLFPVLGRVRAFSDAPRAAGLAREPAVVRDLTFQSLRELFRRLSTHCPTVLILDDLQWADGESLALLDELLRPPDPPPMVVIMLSRPGRGTPEPVRSAVARWQEAAGYVAQHHLEGLPFEQARQLALQLLGGDPARAKAVAREAAGHPLLIETLVRYGDTGATKLESAVLQRVAELEPLSRTFLEAVCLAGVPLSQQMLGAVADVPPEQIGRLVAHLRVERLLRSGGGEHRERVEAYHDRIRVVIAESLPAQRRRKLHAALALRLEANKEGVDQEALARHWEGADRPDRAARAAVRGGDLALSALAFDKAARLYERALSLDPNLDRASEVRSGRAEAYERAGNAKRAAQAYLDALEHAEGFEAIRLRRHATENLLRCGETEAGLRMAGELMEVLGIQFPRSNGHALRRASWFWLRRKLRGEDFQERRLEEVPPEALERIDSLYAVSAALGPTRTAYATALQMQHSVMALEVGEPGRVARALSVDALGMLFLGKLDAIPATLERANELVARGNDPEIKALCRFSEGLILSRIDDLGPAVDALQDAESVLVKYAVGRGYILNGVRCAKLRAMPEVGRFREFLQQAPALMRANENAEDPYARFQTRLYVAPCYLLMLGQPERVPEAIERSEGLVNNMADSDRWLRLSYELRTGFCAGDPDASATFVERYPRLVEQRLDRSPMTRSRVLLMYAQSCGDMARRRPAKRKRWVREAQRAARRLQRFRLEAAGRLASASAAYGAGDMDGCLEHLSAAENGFEQVRALGLVEAIRHTRGRLLGGEEGAALCHVAVRFMAEQGVVDPERFVHTLVPGFEAPDS